MIRISSIYCIVCAGAVSLLCAGCRDGRREDRAFNPVLEKELAAVRETPSSFTYQIRSGDTMWRISRKFGIGLAQLAEANRMEVTSTLKTGQILRIPTGDDSPEAGNDAVPSADGGGYTWPVKGRIVTPFGAIRDGLKSWGIDILAESGASVVAAGSGTVQKAGPFVGMGNTVVIQHDRKGDMISMCGGLENLRVAQGDKVAKGQVIATVPRSAGTGAEIHFRIYNDGRPVNPEGYVK